MKRTFGAVTALVLGVAGVVVFLQRSSQPRQETASTDQISAPNPTDPARAAARLVAVGPRLTSNQTSEPLSVYGEGLEQGMRLALGPPVSRELPLKVVDARHAYARLPAGVVLPPELPVASVEVRLLAAPGSPVPEGGARLDVVNDTAFPDLFALALAPDGRTAFIASPPTDTVFALELSTGRVTALPTADGPSAIATYKDAGGRGWLAVAHRFSPELRLYELDLPSKAPRVLPAPAGAMGLTVDARGEVAFLAEQVRDTVRAVSLADGKERWVAAVDPNPRELAQWKDLLAVGSLQTGQVELLRQSDGGQVATLVPEPGVPIVGGGTERFSKQVMGGKAPRGMVASERLGRLFVSSLGPNVGPNAERMEV
ncbi:MAG TPA: MtsA protein, partial [Hyalangium sp.]|nr:MtsA protein [Hyalangium sp.]